MTAARSALTTDGLLVHLTPGSIGSNADTWSDTDGRPITFTAPTGAAKPALVTSGLGGLPALRFSGAQYMTTALGDTANWQGFTVVAVVKSRSSIPQYSTVLGSGGGAGWAAPTAGVRWAAGVGADAAEGRGWAGAAATLQLGSGSGQFEANKPYVLTWKRGRGAGTGWTIRKNGVALNASPIVDSSFPTGTFNTYLGVEGITPSGGAAYGGSLELSELLIYRRELTTAESEELEQELSVRYTVPFHKVVAWLNPATIGPNATSWNSTAAAPITFAAGPGSAAPALIGGPGGLPAVRFAGAQYMHASLGDTALWDGFTVVAVFTTLNQIPQYTALFGSGGAFVASQWSPAGWDAPTEGIRWGQGVGLDPAQGLGWYGTGGPGEDLGNGNFTPNSTYTMVWKHGKGSAAGWTVRKNGVQTTPTPIVDPTFPIGAFNAYLGAEGINRTVSPILRWAVKADVSEVIVYGRELSDAECAGAESELARKYSVPPPPPPHEIVLVPATIGAGAATWMDQVSGQVVLHAGTGAAAPQLATGPGGAPAVRFSGGQYMYAPIGDTTYWSGFTAVVVFRTGGTVPQYGALLGSGGGSTWTNHTNGVRWAAGVGTDATQGIGWSGYPNTINLGDGTFVPNTDYLAVWKRGRTATDGWTVRVNGLSVTPTPLPDSTFPTGTFHAYLGAEGLGPNGLAYGSTVDVSEVRIYPSLLSDPQVTSLETTLLTAYGIDRATHGNGQGPCLTNADCVAGLRCGFGIGPCFDRPATEGVCWNPSAPPTCCIPNCGAAGTPDSCGTGGICPPCVAGADSDGDGLLDCGERDDGAAWTDALGFNGVDAQRGASCHAAPSCDLIDGQEELDACFSPLEDKRLSSGWNFATTDRNICDPGFGFSPTWNGCGTDFAVSYRAAIRILEDGMHCFAVEGGIENQCSAIYFNGEATAATPVTGPACFDLVAGVYPIGWFYETTSSSTNELHVLHCFGGTSSCMPTAAVPAEDLRPEASADERVCGATESCTEFCPCGEGGQPTDPLNPRQCRPGLVIRTDVAEFFGLPSGTPVCWDPICDDRQSELFECGTPGARCGSVCPSCTAACDGNSCGYNGCWDHCGDGICGNGELGCASDTDCESGLTCVLSADGPNTCLPEVCRSPALDPCADPANAGEQTECGVCPSCVPNCDGKDCGDNGCKGTCGGALGANEYCSPEGHVYAVLDAGLPASPLDGAGVGGTLPGGLEVTDFGQAVYAIPLQLPPGRNGIQPELAITYNSAGGNGYLGMGWGLSGLSAIHRCPKTLAQDGELRGVTYTQEDRFCLDGNRLVAQDEDTTYGGDRAYYHTEVETFARIQSIGTGPEPSSFEVLARDGRVLTYGLRIGGNTPLEGNGMRRANYSEGEPDDVRTHTWALTEVRDRIGNTMKIDYFIPPRCADGPLVASAACDPVVGGAVREYYPKTIRYTSAPGVDSDRFISFEYHQRNDFLHGYQYGVRFERSQLLHRIEAVVQGKTAFEYRLEYDEAEDESEGGVAPPHRRSLLTSVQQCARASLDRGGSAVTCKPATTFEYQPVEPGFTMTLADGAPLPTIADEDALFLGRPVTLDFDGNGQDDVLFPVCTGFTEGTCVAAAWRLMLNGGALGTTEYPRMVVRSKFDRLDPAVNYVVDLDFDGRDELLEIDAVHRKGVDGTVARIWKLVPGEGLTVAPFDLGLSGQSETGGNVYVLDADGDGAADLVDCLPKLRSPRVAQPSIPVSGLWHLRRGDHVGGFEDAELVAEEGPRCFDAMGLDLNGDGAQELLLDVSPLHVPRYAREGSESTIGRNSTDILWPTTGEVTVGVLPATKGRILRVPLDTNGDGLIDVVDFEADRKAPLFWINTGSGFVSKARRDIDLSQFEWPLSGDEFLLELVRRGMPFDENGDGRTDLLVKATATEWVVLRSRGAYFEVVPIDIPGDTLVVLDADQDGLSDLRTRLHLLTRRGADSPRLLAATNGLGARSEVQYEDLSHRDVPTSNVGENLYATTVYNDEDRVGDCEYPCYRRHPRGAVVRRIEHHTPEGIRSFRYQYADAAQDLLGRGSLGFGARITVDERRDGLLDDPESVEDGRTGSFRIFSKRAERDADLGIYPFVGVAMTEAHVVFATNGDSNTRAITREVTTLEPTAGSIFPYVEGERELVLETKGGASAILKDLRREWTYDVYGNLTEERTIWSPVEAPVVDRTITRTPLIDDAHVEHWLINLPHEVLVKSERNGIASRLERFAYFGEESPLAWTGLPESVTVEPGDFNAELVTSYAYDDLGMLLEVSTSGRELGLQQTRTTELEYTDAQRLFPTKLTDANGHEIHLTHDPALGVLVHTREKLREGDANLEITELLWPDGFGRPRLQTSADGATTTYTYQARPPNVGGYVTTQSRPGMPFASAQYDMLGREVSREVDGLSDRLTVLTRYTSLGLVREVSRAHVAGQAEPDFTSFSYDALDRPLEVTFPDATEIERCYHGTVSCTRNVRGFTRCAVTDEQGGTVYGVDPQPVSETCQAAAAAVFAEFPVEGTPESQRKATRYRYGPFDSLEAVIDPRGWATHFTHDNFERLTSRSDHSRGSAIWGYNAFGELQSELDGNGRAATFQHDVLGRLTNRTDLDGSGTPFFDTTWAWDDPAAPGAYGQLARTETSDGVQRHFSYDDFGRHTELLTTVPDDAGVQGMTRSLDYYDDSKRLRTITYESATDPAHPIRIRHRYNERGHLDLLYEPSQTQPNLPAFDPAHDQRYWSAIGENEYGQLAQELFGNGLSTVRSYEPNTGRLDELSTGAAFPAFGYNYDYHPDGNLQRSTDLVDGEQTEYIYDWLDRLESATTRSSSDEVLRAESLTYDDVGSILTRSLSGSELAEPRLLIYDYFEGEHPDRIARVHEGSAAPEWEYDGNGNLTGRSELAGMLGPIAMTYNHLGLPSRVGTSTGAADEMGLVYDSEGVRVRKHSIGGTQPETFYLDDSYQRIRVPGTSGSIERVSVLAGGRAVADVTRDASGAQQVQYLHEDHLGSIIAITDDAGAVVERRKYEAFGRHRSVSPAASEPTRRDYTGHEFDPEFGLVNMNARLYDPALGRFLQADSIIPDPGSSQGINAYAYALNNPTRYVDPSGNNPVVGFAIFGGIGAGVVGGFMIVDAIMSGAAVVAASTAPVDATPVGPVLAVGIVVSAVVVAAVLDSLLDDGPSTSSTRTMDARDEQSSVTAETALATAIVAAAGSAQQGAVRVGAPDGRGRMHDPIPCTTEGYSCGAPGRTTPAPRTPTKAEALAIEKGIDGPTGIHARTLDLDVEFGFVVYQERRKGAEPQLGAISGGNSRFVDIPMGPIGTRTLLIVHAHTAHGLAQVGEVFSRADVSGPPNITQLVVTPTGRVLSFNPRTKTMHELRGSHRPAGLHRRRKTFVPPGGEP